MSCRRERCGPTQLQSCTSNKQASWNVWPQLNWSSRAWPPSWKDVRRQIQHSGIWPNYFYGFFCPTSIYSLFKSPARSGLHQPLWTIGYNWHLFAILSFKILCVFPPWVSAFNHEQPRPDVLYHTSWLSQPSIQCLEVSGTQSRLWDEVSLLQILWAFGLRLNRLNSPIQPWNENPPTVDPCKILKFQAPNHPISRHVLAH